MSDQVTMQESLGEWVTSWGLPDSVFNLSPLSVAGLAGVAFGTSVYLMSKPVEANPIRGQTLRWPNLLADEPAWDYYFY